MRALKLDFVPRKRRYRWLGFALLAAGVAVSAYVANAYVEATAELERREHEQRKALQAERRSAAPAEAVDQAALQAEIAAANRVIARLSLPWDALFKEIEASVDENVVLLSLEPHVEKAEIRIQAEAKDLAAMLGYVQRLQSVPIFKNAHLTNHQIQQQDPQRPVRFTVHAAWVHEPASQ